MKSRRQTGGEFRTGFGTNGNRRLLALAEPFAQLPLFFNRQLFNCRLNFCHRAHRGKLADCRPTGKDADHPARLFHRFPLASG